MRSSTSSLSDRRAVLFGLAAVLAAAGLPGSAKAAYAGPFRGVAVDVGPMIARSGPGPFPSLVRAELTRALEQAFAGRIVPQDKRLPVLVVTVKSVSFSAFSGGTGGRGSHGGGDPGNDWFEGWITVGDETQPLLVNHASPGSGERFGVERDEALRLHGVLQATAYWTRRRLGG
jgi:hypothetical protein